MGTIDRDRVGGVRGMKNAKDKEEDVWVLYRQRQRRRGEMK